MVIRSIGTSSHKTRGPDLAGWSLSLTTVLLLGFFANQFVSDWNVFRSSYRDVQSGDFPHYYIAAKMAALGPQHLLYYPARSSKEAGLSKISTDTEWNQLAHSCGLRDTLHFSAPPEVALLLMPIGKLPFQQAYLAWTVFSELCFFAAICVCLKLCGAFTPMTVLVCTFAGFAFQPVVLTFEKGQFGTVLLLLWSLGTLLASRKKDTASALMFALATIIKLTPALALGVFVMRRRWRWLAAYALWMTIILGLGMASSGLENHRIFLNKMKTLSSGVAGPYNYSLTGIVQNAYYHTVPNNEQMLDDTPVSVQALNKLLGLGVYFSAIVMLWKMNEEDITFDLVTASFLVLLIAPFTWRHYYALEVLPLIFMWVRLKEGFTNGNRWVLPLISVCTLVPATRYPDYLQTHLSNGPIRILLVGLLPASALVLLGTLVVAFGNRAYQETGRNEPIHSRPVAVAV